MVATHRLSLVSVLQPVSVTCNFFAEEATWWLIFNQKKEKEKIYYFWRYFDRREILSLCYTIQTATV